MSAVVCGVITAAVVGSVVIAGIKCIGRFASRLVPFMRLFYFTGGTTIPLKRFPALSARAELPATRTPGPDTVRSALRSQFSSHPRVTRQTC